jgi:hypothetical protein
VVADARVSSVASTEGVRLEPRPGADALAPAAAGSEGSVQPGLGRCDRRPPGPVVLSPAQYPCVPRVYLSRWTQRSTSF